MKYCIKIEAKGLLDIVGENCSSILEVNVENGELEDVLGKALYRVEIQGYPFKTCDLYDEIISNLNALSALRYQYQRIYSSDILTVSVKLL